MKILDTTIRDGSYAVDFKFTTADVKNIVSRLVRLGFEYIEIGHGQGLNASSPERGLALHSDEEYIEAAKAVAENAKIGMFCIPEIARLQDLKIAKEHGISFLRIGVSVDQVYSAVKYICAAKNLGLEVMVNFMKTYVATPTETAHSAKTACECGADYVYIVDSAGCMLPEDITDYTNAIRQETQNIKLGFHGHNNLGLAVSNSLHCVELDYDLIDCSFQGLGRSIGNASTEQVVMALEKKFGTKKIDMDIPRLLEYGYILLKDIKERNLQSPLDLICGYAGFHSGYLKDIYRCCHEVDVDPLRLIIAYSLENQKNMDYDRLCLVAKTLPKDDFDNHPYNFRNFFAEKYCES